VDSGFDQNQSEFTVFVLSVLLQMLSDGDSLFDQEMKKQFVIEEPATLAAQNQTFLREWV